MKRLTVRKPLKTSLFILILVSGFLSVPVFAETVSVFFTASLNGNLIGCECKGVPKGGLSSSATLLRTIDHSNSVVVDLGDVLDARVDNLLSATMMKLYKDIGYDLVAAGDQEFASGVDFFKQNSRTTDYISNNIVLDGRMITPEPVIYNRKGVKIGIASVTSSSVFYFYPDEVKSRLKINDPAETAAVMQEMMDDADIKILLYHGHIDDAEALFNIQNGWDAVLAAHDQMLYEKADGNRMLLSPGEEGNRVGRIDFDVRFGKIRSTEHSFRYFNYKVDPQDPGVEKAFDEYKKELIKNLKNG